MHLEASGLSSSRLNSWAPTAIVTEPGFDKASMSLFQPPSAMVAPPRKEMQRYNHRR